MIAGKNSREVIVKNSGIFYVCLRLYQLIGLKKSRILIYYFLEAIRKQL